MTTPSPQPTAESAQPDEEKYSCDRSKDVRNGFICGAWSVRSEGPILNFETMERKRYVFRCDRPEGHTGQHCDSILLTNWIGPHSPKAPPAESERPQFEDNYSEAAAFAGITFSQACQFDMYMKYLLGKGPKPGFLVSERPSMSTEKAAIPERWIPLYHEAVGADLARMNISRGVAPRHIKLLIEELGSAEAKLAALLKPQGETPEGGRKRDRPDDDATRIKDKILTKVNMDGEPPEVWIWEALAVLEAEGKLPVEPDAASLPPSEPVSPTHEGMAAICTHCGWTKGSHFHPHQGYTCKMFPLNPGEPFATSEMFHAEPVSPQPQYPDEYDKCGCICHRDGSVECLRCADQHTESPLPGREAQFKISDYEVGPDYLPNRIKEFETKYGVRSDAMLVAYRADMLDPGNLDFDEWSFLVEQSQYAAAPQLPVRPEE